MKRGKLAENAFKRSVLKQIKIILTLHKTGLEQLRKKGSVTLNKSCCYCGRIHGINDECARKPKREYNIRADKNAVFRRTNKWRRKSIQIMQRDLYLCRHCLACGETAGKEDV